MRRTVLRLGLFAASGALLALQVDARIQVPVDPLLRVVGQYLETYRRHVSGVVLDEDYLQEAQGSVITGRRLRSDLAITADDDVGWVEFRDIYEVDGRAVRDRADRVIALFAKPAADAMNQARRLVSEGARHNLAPVGVQLDRTINLPLVAPRYFLPSTQSRSAFRQDGFETVAGVRAAVIRFTETARPRLVGTPDDAPASGVAWVDVATGRFVRTEFTLTSRRGTTTVAARVTVEYAPEPRWDLWLPRLMEETYAISDGMGRAVGSLSGRARYANARRFGVVIDEAVVSSGTP